MLQVPCQLSLARQVVRLQLRPGACGAQRSHIANQNFHRRALQDFKLGLREPDSDTDTVPSESEQTVFFASNLKYSSLATHRSSEAFVQ